MLSDTLDGDGGLVRRHAWWVMGWAGLGAGGAWGDRTVVILLMCACRGDDAVEVIASG